MRDQSSVIYFLQLWKPLDSGSRAVSFGSLADMSSFVAKIASECMSYDLLRQQQFMRQCPMTFFEKDMGSLTCAYAAAGAASIFQTFHARATGKGMRKPG